MVKPLHNKLANKLWQNCHVFVVTGLIIFVASFQRSSMLKPVFYDYQKKKSTVKTVDIRFHEMANILIIISSSTSIDHLLQNSLREIAILNWAANNTIGPECCNLGDDKSNIFACLATRNSQELLPVVLTSTLIQVQFSRPMDFGPLKIKRYAEKTITM